ncbi:site-specific integrase [Aquimarina algiphila]|uniref:Site-specific integrase n=1 Tax=Aquimarina algiphila TaxID=2047982 RepID=A0A554VIR8_9FLAO|nr:site-specific integrase [Aquimarina algiphila]TSE07725.1 site-specific integrase [Aquimarina algiphila]
MEIKLRKKKIKNGRYSLYLEYYKGYILKNGKPHNLKEYEFLKLYVYADPKTQKEKLVNKENYGLAESILAIKKSDLIKGKHGIANTRKKKVRFLDFYKKVKNDRMDSQANYDNWDAAQKHLEKYCPANLSFQDIDKEFVLGFKKYLDSEAKTKSDTSLAQNSKYTYFNKFRAALKQAYEEDYLHDNVVKGVNGFEQGETKREYLTLSELQNLSKAECKHKMLKKAFLFSCMTGLRWSDINKMLWSEVRDEDEGSRIIFKQYKTDGLEYLYISEEARELLGERQGMNDRVFVGLKYGAHFNAEILRWCMRAGITKHITFHSARHTNAVLLLSHGADIYTVSKLLGHREIRTTQIYAKIVDQKAKEASTLIPRITIK